LGIAAHNSEDKLLVKDPDGMGVELVETAAAFQSEFWDGGIERQHAIKGIYSTTLALSSPERSHGLYTNELTFVASPSKNGPTRYKVGTSWIDVVTPETASRGRMGAGTIHHIAFRAKDDAEQREWLQKVGNLGLNVSPIMDRKYFHSIYFRERNGVLFEIATDGPGMDLDEPFEHLGEGLALPSEYEPMRETLARELTPIVAGRTPANV
jgi:glyoxalase family protein